MIVLLPAPFLPRRHVISSFRKTIETPLTAFLPVSYILVRFASKAPFCGSKFFRGTSWNLYSSIGEIMLLISCYRGGG